METPRSACRGLLASPITCKTNLAASYSIKKTHGHVLLSFARRCACARANICVRPYKCCLHAAWQRRAVCMVNEWIACICCPWTSHFTKPQPCYAYCSCMSTVCQSPGCWSGPQTFFAKLTAMLRMQVDDSSPRNSSFCTIRLLT